MEAKTEADEIEVTPEMIEAALHELWRQHEGSFIHDVMDIDRGVVGAMLRAALGARS